MIDMLLGFIGDVEHIIIDFACSTVDYFLPFSTTDHFIPLCNGKFIRSDGHAESKQFSGRVQHLRIGYLCEQTE
jgi:hypothetical protein